jgi:hypothetical protein
VTTGKIKNAAVITQKIADGAVTAAKMDPALLASLSAQLTTYDMPVVTATQQVYSLRGDFKSNGATICQTTGADTEVRDLARTDLGGGITRIEVTRQRFAGGIGGTPCHYQTYTLIDDGIRLQLVQRKKYNNTGTTLNVTDTTEYDASTCNDCGIILRANDMPVVVQPLLWGGEGESDDGSNPPTVQVYLGRTTLVEANVTVGSFSGCVTYAQERHSKFLGYFTQSSTICPTVGRVYTQRVRDDGRSQVWELDSYTAP